MIPKLVFCPKCKRPIRTRFNDMGGIHVSGNITIECGHKTIFGNGKKVVECGGKVIIRNKQKEVCSGG